MEVQLALTLSPTTNVSFPCSYECGNKEVVEYDMMEKEKEKEKKKKRDYDEAFEDEVNSTDVSRTLSLFVWNNGGGEEDQEEEEEEDEDDEKGVKNHSLDFYKKDDDEDDEDGTTGWPPINSWRKRLCQAGRNTHHYVRVENNGGRRLLPNHNNNNNNNNSMYVKVKMEGVGIARKVDLSLHQSFDTLTNTLIGMFGKSQENLEAYKLAYQDKQGVWELAKDVTWGTFLRSVQRLQLLKNGD